MGVQVDGFGVALRDLEQLRDDLNTLPEAWHDIAARAATAAAGLAPHRSGRLAGTVQVVEARGRAVVTAGSAAVPYAGPINYGWPARHIRAALFLERAGDQVTPEAAEILQTEANRAIERNGF